MKNDKAYLTLQNGKQFVGRRFGADGEIFTCGAGRLAADHV